MPWKMSITSAFGGRYLGRVYSAMLRQNGNPISFKLKINSKLVTGRQHCIWGGEGNPDRVVNTAKFGDVSAYQTISLNLKDRPFCTGVPTVRRQGQRRRAQPQHPRLDRPPTLPPRE
jgi:hypothetical protein